LLLARGVAKRFGATAALAGLDLELAPGEVHGLVGENGAGKSTAIRVLCGAVRPDAGRLEFDGRPYAPAGPRAALAAGIATIHQELALAPHLDVAENIGLVDLPRRGPFVDRTRLVATARAALAEVGCTDVDPRERVARLPLARRQLVEVARALVHGSRLVVFDEPTSSLDARDAARLMDLVERLRARGLAVLYVSHALDEVVRLCDRVTVMRDGRSVAHATRGAFDAASLVAAMGGRELARGAAERAEPGEVVLGIARRDGRGAALELRAGEVVGLAGLVGAGRTELLREFFGLAATRTFRFEGPGVAQRATPRARWRAGFGLVSEDRAREGLALRRPLDENLCLPGLARLAPRGWLAPRRLAERARDLAARLGVRAADVRASVGVLSGGNQQKVAIARLIESDVRVFLLDEPTRGVDVAAKAEIHASLRALVRARGGPTRAALVVSSELPELFALCDRIAVVRAGVLGPALPVEELDEARVLSQAVGAGGAA